MLSLEMVYDQRFSPLKFGGFDAIPDSTDLVVSTGNSDGCYLLQRLDVLTGNRTSLNIQGRSPKVSPDGMQFLFTSEQHHDRTICRYHLTTEKVVELFPADLVFSAQACWSPDADRIATVVKIEPSLEAVPAKPFPDSSARVYSVRPLQPAYEIRILELDTRRWTTVYQSVALIRDLSWAGNYLVFHAVVPLIADTDSDPKGEIRVLDLQTGDAVTVVEKGGIQHLRPVPSPDGRLIAFNYDPNNLNYPYFCHLAIIPTGGGSVRQLTRDKFINGTSAWASDGEGIYFVFGEGVYRQIGYSDLSGNTRVLTDSPSWKKPRIVAVSGRSVVGFHATDADCRSYVAVKSEGEENVLLDLTAHTGSDILGESEEIEVDHDGLQLKGLLVTPKRGVPGNLPLIVQLHGGPVGGVRDASSTIVGGPVEWQFWTSLGYAVLLPDYRSSLVYGWNEFELGKSRQDFHERDFSDIQAIIDFVLKSRSVDKSRMCLMGHSYGATLTNWMLTRTDMFRAALSFDGIVDHVYQYGTGNLAGKGVKTLEYQFGGEPWKAEGNYRKSSAFPGIGNVKTPTLLAVAGPRMLYQYEYMYTALKKLRVPVELVSYPDEYHALRRIENKKDLLTRTADWFSRHLYQDDAM